MKVEKYKCFDCEELAFPNLPEEQHRKTNFFNPSIFTIDCKTIMAYRVVGPDLRRRIVLCRLDEDDAIDKSSAVCISDHFHFSPNINVNPHHWYADPRLFTHRGRLYCHFNNNWPPDGRANQIFIVELDRTTLFPIGPVREVIKLDGRSLIEKNWMFFEHDDSLYALYQLHPKTLLDVDLSGDMIVANVRDVASWDASNYQNQYGPLRGGATPILYGGVYWTVFHTCYQTADDAQVGKWKYVGGLLLLHCTPPFPVVAISNGPIVQLTPEEKLMAAPMILNPHCCEIAYPCGAAVSQSGLKVSYGINDAFSALRLLKFDRDEMIYFSS